MHWGYHSGTDKKDKANARQARPKLKPYQPGYGGTPIAGLVRDRDLRWRIVATGYRFSEKDERVPITRAKRLMAPEEPLVGLPLEFKNLDSPRRCSRVAAGGIQYPEFERGGIETSAIITNFVTSRGNLPRTTDSNCRHFRFRAIVLVACVAYDATDRADRPSSRLAIVFGLRP